MKTTHSNMTKMATLVSVAVLQMGAAWAQEASTSLDASAPVVAEKNSL